MALYRRMQWGWMMVKAKTWVHRILGLTILVGFWVAVCAGLAWGLYAPLSNVLGWVAFGVAWAALLYAGDTINECAMRSITKGASLFDVRAVSQCARRSS